MSSKNFFWAQMSEVLLLSFENCRKPCEGSHQSAGNWCENHVGIQLQVSNYKKFKLDTHVLITWQVGTRGTNHDRDFSYIYDDDDDDYYYY